MNDLPLLTLTQGRIAAKFLFDDFTQRVVHFTADCR